MKRLAAPNPPLTVWFLFWCAAEARCHDAAAQCEGGGLLLFAHLRSWRCCQLCMRARLPSHAVARTLIFELFGKSRLLLIDLPRLGLRNVTRVSAVGRAPGVRLVCLVLFR